MKTKYFSIRRSMSAIIAAVITLSCVTTAANATIFYISTTGNDATGNGTSLKPWKTLYKATSVVITVGDIIHVNAGVYSETLQSNLKQGVSIEGDGITSVIVGTNNTEFTPIINLISAEGSNGNQHISNLKFDGNNLIAAMAIIIEGRSNVSINNCTFTNFFYSAVMWAGRTDFNGMPPTIYATGNSFHDNITNNCAFADATYGRGAFQFGGQNGMLIYNNTMTETGRAAGTQGWPIKYSNEGYTKNCKIYNNTLKVAPFPYPFNGYNNYWNFAIELFNEQGLEIYGNNIEGSIDLNHQTKGTSAYSIYIHDNTIGHTQSASTWEDGIIMEYETNDAIVEKNIIKNSMDGISFSLRTGSTLNNIRINNNLIYNIGITDGTKQGLAIRLITSDEIYTAYNFAVVNNVFIGLSGANSPWWGVNIPSGTSARNVKLCNNIIENFDAGCLVTSKGSAIDSLAIENNIFYANGNNNTPYFSNGTPTNSYIANNYTSDPMFVSPTDFHLQATSPGINSGIYVGLPYAGAAPDRGYAENGTTLPITLLNMSVIDNKGKNLLQWSTATEINSNYFSVERSGNGIDFVQVGTVSASGFSSTIMNYSFTDANPLNGINYYRLVMVDKDKASDYSNVVSISSKHNQTLNIVSAQLSSSTSNLTLAVNATQAVKTLLMVFDANGRSILNTPVVLQSGINKIEKNTSFAPKGIYFVKLVSTDEGIVKNILATE